MCTRILTFALVCACGPLAVADSLSPDELQQLATDLDSDEFAVREAASQKLRDAGETAVDACVEIAHGESYEASYRAVEVLKQLRGQSETRDAANQALRKLADSEHEVAARLANDVYAAERVPLRVSPESRYRSRRRVSTRIINGNRHTEASEGNRQVVIDQTADGAISMRVTETHDGHQHVHQFSADDVQQLRTKHPDAYIIFLRYGGRVGRFARGGRDRDDVRRRIDDIRAEHLKGQIKNLQRIIELQRRNGNEQAVQNLERVIERLRDQIR